MKYHMGFLRENSNPLILLYKCISNILIHGTPSSDAAGTLYSYKIGEDLSTVIITSEGRIFSLASQGWAICAAGGA